MPRYTHDQYFRAAMGYPSVAEAFLKAYLPVGLPELLNWEGLEPQTTISLDRELKTRIADVIYKIPLLLGGCIYVIVEHQSKPSRLMPLRLLEYTARVIRYHYRTYPEEQLVEVIPLIVYTGEAPYSYSTSLWEMLDAHLGFMKQCWVGDLPCVSLHSVPVSADPSQQLMQTCFQCVYESAEEAISMLNALMDGAPLNQDLWEQSLMYLSEQFSPEQYLELCDKIESQTDQREDKIMMSAAETWRREGKAIGIKEGRQEERQHIVKQLLAKGFSMDEIARLIQVDQQALTLFEER